MDSEIVLFLRACVPETRLHEALSDTFGVAPENSDAPLVVRYAQGFATGVSVPCNDASVAWHAANTLSERLGTAVLLEAGDGAQWLLFTPGASHPLGVGVVELRHGLDVLLPMTADARLAGSAYT
jgi:hypothetical protein